MQAQAAVLNSAGQLLAPAHMILKTCAHASWDFQGTQVALPPAAEPQGSVCDEFAAFLCAIANDFENAPATPPETQQTDHITTAQTNLTPKVRPACMFAMQYRAYVIPHCMTGSWRLDAKEACIQLGNIS